MLPLLTRARLQHLLPPKVPSREPGDQSGGSERASKWCRATQPEVDASLNLRSSLLPCLGASATASANRSALSPGGNYYFPSISPLNRSELNRGGLLRNSPQVSRDLRVQGAVGHQRSCSRCTVKPEMEDTESETPPPPQGQMYNRSETQAAILKKYTLRSTGHHRTQ